MAKPNLNMQAVFTYPMDPDKGPPPFHAGDFPYDPEDGNKGVPAEHWDKEDSFPVIVDYDPATGHAEWWPPMMCGPPPAEAPWSHPTAALSMGRMEMFALLDARIAELY